MTQIISGVDVSSRWLDASIGRSGPPQRFTNSPEGIAQLADLCRTHHVHLVAMEATGGYERQAFALLSEHGLPVAILNPRQVRQFAQSMGKLEKTDAIDASMIAFFAEVNNSRPSALSPPGQQHLRALVTRLRQLSVGRKNLTRAPMLHPKLFFANFLSKIACQAPAHPTKRKSPITTHLFAQKIVGKFTPSKPVQLKRVGRWDMRRTHLARTSHEPKFQAVSL